MERYPRIEGQYELMGERHVRVGPYLAAELHRLTADSIEVRVYEPIAVQAPSALEYALPQVQLDRSARYALEAFDVGLPKSGQWRDDFAVGDLDGDMHLDILSPPARKSLTRPEVFRGNGRGEWMRWEAPSWPRLPYDYGGAASADVDGDGRLELALGMHLRGFTVLTPTGVPGVFERLDAGLPQIETIDQHGLSGVQLALAAGAGGKTQLLLVDEGLQPAQTSERRRLHAFVWRSADRSWERVAVPKPLDWAAAVRLAQTSARVDGQWLWAQLADQTQVWAHWHAGRWTVIPAEGVVPGCRATSVAVAEGVQGKPQFAISCRYTGGDRWWSQVQLLRADAEPIVLQAGSSAEVVTRLAFARFAGAAAMPDLAMLRESGELRLVAAAANGGYSLDHVEALPDWLEGCRGFALRVADLDADGRDELIAGFAGERALLETGAGCRDGGALRAWRVRGAE